MFEKIAQQVYYHGVSILTTLLILASALVYRRGNRTNLIIASTWKETITPLLSTHFKNYEAKLVPESANIIKMYASGRRHCPFAIFAFALVPRQNIVSFLLNGTFIRLKDELVMEIPIHAEHPLNITLAILRKKDLRTITKKDYPDIKLLCKQFAGSPSSSVSVPPTHSLLVERSSHAKIILRNEIDHQFWHLYGGQIKLVYISDVNKFSRYELALRVVVSIGPKLPSILEWAFELVDRVATFHMPPEERADARHRRDNPELKYDN